MVTPRTPKLYRQPNDYTCVPACVKMLLKSHGKNVPFSRISKGCKTDKDGSYMEYAAAYLARMGLRPTLYLQEKIYPRWYRYAGKRRIYTSIKRQANQGTAPKGLERLMTYIGSRGFFKSYPASTADILKMLKKRRPVIVAVENKILSPWPMKKSDPHVVLAVGYSKNSIKILDPFPRNFKQPRIIPLELFEKARSKCDGSIIYI